MSKMRHPIRRADSSHIQFYKSITHNKEFGFYREWNGENIIHYPCCTLYNGTIVYNILCDNNVYKKVFDRKYMSINATTIEVEITEEEWQKMLDEI